MAIQLLNQIFKCNPRDVFRLNTPSMDSFQVSNF